MISVVDYPNMYSCNLLNFILDMFLVSGFRDRSIAKELKFTPVFEESEPLPIIDQVYTWFNSYVRVTTVVDEGANCTCLLRLPKKYQLDEE